MCVAQDRAAEMSPEFRSSEMRDDEDSQLIGNLELETTQQPVFGRWPVGLTDCLGLKSPVWILGLIHGIRAPQAFLWSEGVTWLPRACISLRRAPSLSEVCSPHGETAQPP